MTISWYRVNAVIVRHFYYLLQDWMRIVQIFYWPMLDILIWGYVGRWMDGGDSTSILPYAMIVAGSLWNISVRGCYEISVDFLEEIFSCNLINLFSSPLLLIEWIVASIILALIMACAVGIFLVMCIYVMFDLNVMTFGIPLLIVASQLLFSGLWTGFIGASLVAVWGRRVDSLVYMNGWLLLPFSCVYYTIDVLPGWARMIAKITPMSYAFDAMRSVITTGVAPSYEIGMALALNSLYTILSLLLFHYCFEKSRVQGLERLIN